MAEPSYIIENTAFKKLGLGTLRFHYQSGEIHATKKTYEFAMEHGFDTKYFEIRDNNDNDILLPWMVYSHMEAVSDQIIHCGKTISKSLNSSETLPNLGTETIYMDIIEYGAKCYFGTEIKFENKRPVCVLSFKSKQNLSNRISVSFGLDKFVTFLESNIGCASMYMRYSKGLFLSQIYPTEPKPKHVHFSKHKLFPCTCPDTKYETFAKNNIIVKYKDV